MRIFISMSDETGSHKTCRLSILNCQDTSELIRLISKDLNINKNAFIFLLKNQIVNLRILQNWPLSLYGIKNGSWIILKENYLFSKKQYSNSSTSLSKIQENQQDLALENQISFNSSSHKASFFSHKQDQDYQEYFQKQLNKMLTFVRQNKLDQIALLLKQQPDISEDKLRDQVFINKNIYILNQVGQCGRNSLHWAIHNQNLQIVTFLLMKYADPTILTIDQYTPLQLAVVHRNLQIVRCLLNQPKVDPNKVTVHGTALHLAAYHHSLNLVKQLLEHGSNPQQLDKDGKKSIQLSQIKQIKTLFDDHKKKLKLRLIKPNITKGKVLKISSLTFRGKQRTLMINPFKGDFVLLKQNNVVDHKIKLKSIKEVQKIIEKSWLMDSKVNYFRISYLNQNADQRLIIGIKHVQILGRWLSSLELARVYVNNQKYVSNILPQMQLIQVFDDQKNEVKVHKRQIQTKSKDSPNKNKYSIFDIKVLNETEQIEQKNVTNRKYDNSFPQVLFQQGQLSNSFASSTQGNDHRGSQILLGSILNQKSLESSILSTRNTVSTISLGKNNQCHEDQFLSHPVKLSNFRKKSTDISKISEFKIQEVKKVTFSEFQFKKLLGSGAFGQVFLTKHQKSNKIYAMKVLNKKKLMIKKQLKYAVSETNILKRVNHPFIIGLHISFQTPSNLYLALDYCPYGDLSQILSDKQKFTEMTARFIIAQAILAIQYLHTQKIIYRDLKPQNILIAKDGYIKLIDFGLSKQNHFATSFCGSPAYLSPEMLQKKGHGFPTDIYGLGCVLYQMVIGEPPFYDESMEQMFENIKSARLKFPGYLTKQIKNLLGRMLQRDSSKRIGAGGMKQLKSHQFFNGFSWQKIIKKQLSVPKEVFPQSLETQYYLLQKNMSEDQIKYVDQDYTEASMLNRIKGFSFQREQNI